MPTDFPLIDRSFGFDTAVEETQRAILCAKVEAKAAINGLGLVKVMGRASGQIAMFACLASRDVVRFPVACSSRWLLGVQLPYARWLSPHDCGGASFVTLCSLSLRQFPFLHFSLASRSPGCTSLLHWTSSVAQDVCLIPEIPFELAGPTGLFRCVSDLFNTQGHCVIVVAEGAGMELIDDDLRSYGTDASGNVKRPDIGLWLRARLNEHFASLGRELNLKLIEYVSRGCVRRCGLLRVLLYSCLCLVLPSSCMYTCLCNLLT